MGEMGPEEPSQDQPIQEIGIPSTDIWEREWHSSIQIGISDFQRSRLFHLFHGIMEQFGGKEL